MGTLVAVFGPLGFMVMHELETLWQHYAQLGTPEMRINAVHASAWLTHVAPSCREQLMDTHGRASTLRLQVVGAPAFKSAAYISWRRARPASPRSLRSTPLLSHRTPRGQRCGGRRRERARKGSGSAAKRSRRRRPSRPWARRMPRARAAHNVAWQWSISCGRGCAGGWVNERAFSKAPSGWRAKRGARFRPGSPHTRETQALVGDALLL